MVNLFQLYFLSLHFILNQTDEFSISLLFYPPYQIYMRKKLDLSYPSTFLSLPHFRSFHFCTTPTKQTLRVSLVWVIIERMEN